MKALAIFLSLTLPYCANAYQCAGNDSNGNPVFITAWSDQDGDAHFGLQTVSDTHYGIGKITEWQNSNIGHSRCPGTWSGIRVQAISENPSLKSISILVEKNFFGCGFPPQGSAEIIIDNKAETILLNCKK